MPADPGAPLGAGKKGKLDQATAFLWGFAEATCFFIVPDVWTSRVVLRNARTGFAACLWSVAGALLGGAILYHVGLDDGLRTRYLAFCELLPGIRPDLIETALHSLQHTPGISLIQGALSGIPYKLFAVQFASVAGPGLGAFLMFSAVARLGRFLAVTLLVWLCGTTLLRRCQLKTKQWVHAVAWIGFYAFYFWHFSD